MIIKKLQLKNFQVIEDFNADFEGNIYFVTGDNELGKSTLLKSIGVLLTGERDKVLKDGTEKGFAKMIIGDDNESYKVDLNFSEANPRGTLTITTESTGLKSNNISALQKIFGYTDFDAVEFSRWSETADGRRKQINVVKSLLPEDVQQRITEIDADVVKTKDLRKAVNSDLKNHAAVFDLIESQIKSSDLKTYAKAIDVKDLLEEQNKNAQLKEKAKTVRESLENRTNQLKEIPNRLAAAKKAYEDAVKLINDEKLNFETLKKNCEKWLKDYKDSGAEDSDTETQLLKTEEHNKMHAKVLDYNAKKVQKEASEKKAQTHDAKIETLLKEREKLISDSKLPIEGLTFTDDGLELNGIPFVTGKVSDSQTMEVAAKLIIASNPKVNVFRIARGESLGEKRLKNIIEIAQKNGFQGFIEEVKRGQEELTIEEYTD